MGQRLLVNIHKGDKIICCCGFHWSGYTSSTLEIIRDFINHWEDTKQYRKSVVRCVKTLEMCGATLCVDAKKSNTSKTGYATKVKGSEYEAFKKKYPDVDVNLYDYSDDLHYRQANDGAISFLPKEIKDWQQYPEAVADIYLDSKSFSFDAYFLDELPEHIVEYEGFNVLDQDLILTDDIDDFLVFKWEEIGFAFDVVFNKSNNIIASAKESMVIQHIS